jgi:hypothetical protein
LAEINKTVTPSLATKLPCDGHRSHNLFPAEDIAAGDLCYISATGVRRSTGAAVAAVAYGPSTLVPGTRLYLSGTVVGGLADAASTGGTAPVAVVQYVATQQGTPHAVIHVFKSNY